MKEFLLYYYTNNFAIRKYTYIYATNIDNAWKKAEQIYGKGNLETMSQMKIKSI